MSLMCSMRHATVRFSISFSISRTQRVCDTSRAWYLGMAGLSVCLWCVSCASGIRGVGTEGGGSKCQEAASSSMLCLVVRKQRRQESVYHISWSVHLYPASDYQQVLQWGGSCHVLFEMTSSEYRLGITELPARKIYEEVLPEVVERLTYGDVPYWRGSPYGGNGWDTADPTVGDVVRFLL